MSVLAIRHGKSRANEKADIAYGSPSAGLTDEGHEQAVEVGEQLRAEFGINPYDTSAAVSELRRTSETAIASGFHDLVTYACLNEVEGWKDIPNLREMIRARQLPPQAYAKAEEVLANPPSEKVWFTSSLVVAGISEVLGVYKDRYIIPNFGEIRELPIDN